MPKCRDLTPTLSREKNFFANEKKTLLCLFHSLHSCLCQQMHVRTPRTFKSSRFCVTRYRLGDFYRSLILCNSVIVPYLALLLVSPHWMHASLDSVSSARAHKQRLNSNCGFYYAHKSRKKSLRIDSHHALCR
jgi:hypothetical protein